MCFHTTVESATKIIVTLTVQSFISCGHSSPSLSFSFSVLSFLFLPFSPLGLIFFLVLAPAHPLFSLSSSPFSFFLSYSTSAAGWSLFLSRLAALPLITMYSSLANKKRWWNWLYGSGALYKVGFKAEMEREKNGAEKNAKTIDKRRVSIRAKTEDKEVKSHGDRRVKRNKFCVLKKKRKMDIWALTHLLSLLLFGSKMFQALRELPHLITVSRRLAHLSHY